MEKNLITEIHRISELIGVESKITLNENTIGQLFGQALEAEIKKLLKTEVKNAVRASVKAGATDVDSIVKSLGKNSKAIADAEAKVMVSAGKQTLKKSEKTAIKAEMVRVAKEEAEAATKTATKKITKNVGTQGAEQAGKEGAEQVSKDGLTNVYVNLTNVGNSNIDQALTSNAKNVVENGTEKVTKSGGSRRLTATGEDMALAETKGLTKVVQIGGVDYVMKLAKKGWSFKQIIKSSAVKWGLGLLAAGLIVWWIFATLSDTVPEDIPPTPPNPEDTDNDGGGDGNVYTTPGDPYQYKVVDCVWFTKSLEQRGKIISDWTSLANNQKAIDILDGRFPDARKNCGGNSSTNTNTNTNTNNNTLTPSGTTLNQQYGTEPMANAQAEVQTTNDDINNY
jgi:hypothetical protein